MGVGHSLKNDLFTSTSPLQFRGGLRPCFRGSHPWCWMAIKRYLFQLSLMNLKAMWIWCHGLPERGYNQAAIFVREFDLESIVASELAITADSWYRLRVNGLWINDGPARAYPESYQYDQPDLRDALRPGRNRLEVVVRYFGVGTAHQLPQQAGLWVQLEVFQKDGSRLVITTDETWSAAPFPALIANTARLSIKQEGAELYDARLEVPPLSPACVVEDQSSWNALRPRDCELLGREAFHPRRFMEARLVTSSIWSLTLPAQRLLHPGLIANNFSTSLACGVAYRVVVEKERSCRILLENLALYLDGERINPTPELLEEREVVFPAGEHLLVALVKYPFENQMDLSLTITNPVGIRLEHPFGGEGVCFLRFPLHHWLGSEIPFHMWANRELHHRQQAASKDLEATGQMLKTVADLERPQSLFTMERLPASAFPLDEAHWAFRARETHVSPVDLVAYPQRLLHSMAAWATITPPASGEAIELLLDFGEQVCGYLSFELESGEEGIVDLFAVEYRTPDGVIQHTDDVRNGFRYYSRAGLNRYLSFRRRSGRYLYITLRGFSEPVRLRNIHWVASTYPVNEVGEFSCSSEELNRIWEISVRTVRLCMEDVYTDCPCYEQSLWTGDARNIALFSFPVFASWDLARRCIRLGGASLDRYPIVGSQIPSAWDCLIPAWSFLWSLSVWDLYQETADRDFLREILPQLCHNAEGGLAAIDPDTGLFWMTAWNLFEWVESDIHHPRMVYNSMLLKAALDVTAQVAEVLEAPSDVERYRLASAQLTEAINATWSPDLQAYPDSVRRQEEWIPGPLPANLTPCSSSASSYEPCRDASVHTSMLALLFGIVSPELQAQVEENILNPPPHLFRVRNLFARFYLYSAYEKAGARSRIVKELRAEYLPMLRLGSTTTWENINGYGAFPTRSHSHAWSACAIHFFQRIILGLEMTQPGAAAFDLSPEVEGLDHASGTRATVRGPIRVQWRKEGRCLHLDVEAPAGVQIRFRQNRSMENYEVLYRHLEKK